MKALMASLLLLFFYTTVISQTNIALNKAVTSSSLLSGTNPLTNLVDGSFSTFTSTTNNANNPSSEWILIDLGADYFIDSIIIGCQSGATGHSHLRRFMIVTYPATLTASGGATASQLPNLTNPSQPATYATAAAASYNRLVYTDATQVSGAAGSGPFGTSTAGNVPGASGSFLGPDFPGTNQLGLNIGTHKARYVMLMNLQDEVLDPTEIQIFSTTTSIRSIQNGNFEQGATGTGAGKMVREGVVNGWNATEATGMDFSNTTAPTEGSFIEFWSTNIALGGSTGTVPAFSGSYFVELNAYTAGQLDQRQICVLAGEGFDFGLAHRGRTGMDSMVLRINDVDVAKIWDDKTNTSGVTHHSSSILDASTTSISVATPATITNGWGYYTGHWANTSGLNQLISFGFRAVSSNGGILSVGNFLDSVTFSGLNPTVSFDKATGNGPESVATASLPKLYIIGKITSPLTLDLNITGGTATRGVDYTTTPSSGVITMTLPAGDYDGTDATGVSLSPYIQIVNDNIHEADETINMTIQTPSTGLKIADANICGPAISSAVYTIKDGTLPITLISFAAQKQGDDGLLKWQTGTEINTTAIAIEKSTEGVLGFTEIGRVTPTGDNSYYSFIDDHLMSGINYYRLKIIDRDGRIDYSAIRIIRNSNDNVEMQLFPNPASSVAKLTLPTVSNNEALIKLYNATGSLTQTINATGKQVVDIDISKMPKGLYMVTYYDGSQLYTKKILKQQ